MTTQVLELLHFFEDLNWLKSVKDDGDIDNAVVTVFPQPPIRGYADNSFGPVEGQNHD